MHWLFACFLVVGWVCLPLYKGKATDIPLVRFTGQEGSAGFWLCVMTHSQRLETFMGFLELYCRTPFIGLLGLHVLWNDFAGILPPKTFNIRELVMEGLTVEFEVLRNGSLVDRFAVANKLSRCVRWVLMLDDDVRTPKQYFTETFKKVVAQRQYNQIIGFVGRHYQLTHTGASYIFPRRGTQISLVLTGVAFVSTRLLREYSNRAPPEAELVVRKYISGEDISLNFFVAKSYGRGPVFVDCPFVQTGGPGLSTRADTQKTREAVILELSRIYGEPTPARFASKERVRCPVGNTFR